MANVFATSKSPLMKTTNRLLILIEVELAIPDTIYGQKAIITDQKDHIITLIVNTEEIENTNINVTCYFEGQKEGTSIKEFTTWANVGDRIIWQGEPTVKKEGNIVNITRIQHEHGNDIFSKNMLSGNGQDSEKVVGLVLNLAPAGNEYKYKIFFTVIHNGKKRNGTFRIDPKIQVDD